MPNILFVCSANRFRSVLAAEYFRALMKENDVTGEWEVGSAGIWAREGLSPIKEAVERAAARHLDIDSVRSREISTKLVEAADLIIVMAGGQREAISLEFPSAKDKVFLFSEITDGPTYDIPDPVTSSGEDPQLIAEEIFSLLESGFYQIIARSSS